MSSVIRLLVTLACFFILGLSVSAQNQVAVPDLNGLNVPRAAAELNRLGLRLGEQNVQVWSQEAGVAENTIGAQSVAPGTNVEFGSTVDVTVLRTPNLRMIYDDNEITLVNLTGQAIDISALRFETIEGKSASFDASRWSSELRANQCLQLWSVKRNGSKGLPECQAIQNWLTTVNPSNHFWTGSNGVSVFEVRYNGTVLNVCQAAPSSSQDRPITCEFYLPAGGAGDVAELVYFAYTLDTFAAINPTDDAWLRLNRTTIINPTPNTIQLGASFRLGDAALFENPDIVAEIGRLAPQQCLLVFDSALAATSPPQPCDVIARLGIPSDQRFWLSDFELESRDGRKFTCTGAVEGKRTICVMPR
jgi:hypothetical protein